MKTLFLLFTLTFFGLISAQYNINWQEDPILKIPLKYKLEHFNLKGPVKEYKTVGLVHNFDRNGYLISGRQGDFFEFTYDANKNPTFYTFWKNEGQKTIGKIILDKNGRIIENLYFNGEKYKYDAKGNFTETISNITNETKDGTYIYTYDDKNRSIKAEYYNEKILWEMVSSYKKEGEFLVMTTTRKDFNYAYKNTTVSTYFKNGHRYGNIKNENVKYDQYKNVIGEVDVNGKLHNFQPIKITYYEDAITPEILSNLTKKIELSKANNPKCLTGNCIDGFGTFKDQSGTYQGFFRGGKKDGFGVFKWIEGDIHSGMWKNNITDGFGLFTDTIGYSVEGFFYDGDLNGFASIIKPDKTQEFGDYRNGKIITKFNYFSNNKTTGCVMGDCKNGYGKFIWDDGRKFIGFFKNSALHSGLLTGKNGISYNGEFGPNSTIEGYGNFKYENKEDYYGDFKNNKRNGRGTLYNPTTKTVRSGEWKDDVLVKEY